MKKIIFYTKENCLLCEEVLDLLHLIQDIEPFKLEIKNIYEDDALLEEYQLIIPVIKIDEAILYGKKIDLSTILLKLTD